MNELSENDVQDLYTWIDEIPLSRSKKNISRDFSDGVACAEVVRHFIPKLVDLHNYSPANSISQKIYNWTTLNQRVFRRLGYSTTDEIIDCIVHSKPGYIEYLLYELRQKIDQYLERKARENQSPDHHHHGPTVTHHHHVSPHHVQDTHKHVGHEHGDGPLSRGLSTVTASKATSDQHVQSPSLTTAPNYMHMQSSVMSSNNAFLGGMSGSRMMAAPKPNIPTTTTTMPITTINTPIWTSPKAQHHPPPIHSPTLSLSPRASMSSMTTPYPTVYSYQQHGLTQYPPSSHPVQSSTGSSTMYTTNQVSAQIQQPPQQQSRYMVSSTQQPVPQSHHPKTTTTDPDLVYELQDTINILQLKITKLEQLLTLKDQQIQQLTSKHP